MESYTTDAVVLAKRDIREADRQYTLYTKERGKVRALGIGTRRLSSKLAGHIEVGSHVRVTIVLGRRFDRLIGALRAGGEYRVHPNMLRLNHTVDILTKDAEVDARLFAVVAEAADASYHIQSHPLWLLYSCFALITALGTAPSVEKCGVSSKSLRDTRVAYSHALGTFINVDQKSPDDEVILMNSDTFFCISIIASEPWSMVSHLMPSTTTLVGMTQVIDALVTRYTHTPVFMRQS